jgi:hypothetical protein
MNSDGGRGVAADVNVGLTLPHVRAIAWTLTGVGVSLLLTALIVGAAAVRRRQP